MGHNYLEVLSLDFLDLSVSVRSSVCFSVCLSVCFSACLSLSLGVIVPSSDLTVLALKMQINMRHLIEKPALCYMSRIMRKPVFWVSDQIRHKPGCTATEDGLRFEILDLESTHTGIVYYLCSENKGADQLHS